MNKNYLIIGAAVLGILILAGGGFYFLGQNKSDDGAMIQDNMMDGNDISSEDQIEEDEMMITNDSRYIVYSSGVLDQTADSKRVLYFYANWCPICRPVDAELRENESQIPEDLKVIRVNYNDPETDDEEEELAKTYGITYQHTFVQIDENGNEITKWSSGGLEEILENVK